MTQAARLTAHPDAPAQTQDPVAQALADMRRHFCAGLDERICRIENARIALSTGTADAEETLAVVAFEAHRIVGVAGSIGLTQVGTRARELETLVSERPAGPVTPTDMAAIDLRINDFLDLLEQHLTDA